METKQIALYARVSTADKGQDPQVQLKELREYAQRRGFNETVEFVDHGFSGSNMNRPALKKLLNLARQRRVQFIIVAKIDRFARSLRELVVTLHELNEYGVTFVSVNDNLDFGTASGRLMGNLLGSFAEFELDLIRSRTIAGLNNARAKGKILGRPKRRDDAKIERLRSKGLSIGKIAKELKISKSVVHASLNDRSEKGLENPHTTT